MSIVSQEELPEPGLLRHPDIHPLGLYIHERLKLIYCSACKAVLPPQSVARHISDNHKHLHTKLNEPQILAMAKHYKLEEKLPTIKGPVLQFSGLPLLGGNVKCPICDAIYHRSSIKVHYSSQHSGAPTINFNALLEVPAQRLNKGKFGKSMFEVIISSTCPDPVTSTHSIVDNLRTMRDNLLPKYFSTALDARALSSWMKYTNWHDHVEGYHSSELIALVAMPGKDETHLAKLAEAVTAFYDMGYGFIDDSNTLLLQMLKSEDSDGK
jgi:hypothetical protein